MADPVDHRVAIVVVQVDAVCHQGQLLRVLHLQPSVISRITIVLREHIRIFLIVHPLFFTLFRDMHFSSFDISLPMVFLVFGVSDPVTVLFLNGFHLILGVSISILSFAMRAPVFPDKVLMLVGFLILRWVLFDRVLVAKELVLGGNRQSLH